VIEKMLASSRAPALGGEMRDVTIFFSDLEGFSAFAERMPPAELVALMNRYLSAMTEIIEAQGGFVDKYIGDGIVAVFGAPAEDADHAAQAVAAGLACVARLTTLGLAAPGLGARPLTQRIGLNSGRALVGNIGSRRRFNYTAMGDCVNLAARLEGANKVFGTAILASEATMALTGAAFVWRELDEIRVKGRIEPVRVYEPLSPAGRQSPEQAACAAAYGEGLARWRRRDFAGAAEAFADSAGGDSPSALFLARATRLAQDPPGDDWRPIRNLEEK
jgi:class 3 adenylate cyclase